MAFTTFDKLMQIITLLDDEPNDVGGLTADQLKAKFDEGGLALQDYLNNTLIPALDSLELAGATKAELTAAVNALNADIALRATKTELTAAVAPLATKTELSNAVVPLATKTEVNTAVAPLATKAELNAVVLGQIPDGSLTMLKLSADVQASIIPTYTAVTMLAANWSNNTYSFEADYPSADYNIEVSVADTATAEQFEAAGAAYIGSSATSNVFTAKGDVPTVDIPVIVKVVAK